MLRNPLFFVCIFGLALAGCETDAVLPPPVASTPPATYTVQDPPVPGPTMIIGVSGFSGR